MADLDSSVAMTAVAERFFPNMDENIRRELVSYAQGVMGILTHLGGVIESEKWTNVEELQEWVGYPAEDQTEDMRRNLWDSKLRSRIPRS